MFSSFFRTLIQQREDKANLADEDYEKVKLSLQNHYLECKVIAIIVLF